MRNELNKAILFLTIFLFVLIIFQSYKPYSIVLNNDEKIKKVLITKRWHLMKFDETIDKEKKDYGVAREHFIDHGLSVYPNFLSDGTYIDKQYLKLDSSGKFSKDGFRWATGSWTFKSKTLTININEYSKDYGDRTIGGEMKIKSITDTTLILSKNISRNADWTRTYYLQTY